MTYTKAQWDALQKRLPAEDRVAYADYISSVQVVSSVTQAGGNTTDAVSPTPVTQVTSTPVVDEQSQRAAMAAMTTPTPVASPASVRAANEQVATTPKPTAPSTVPSVSPLDVRDPITGLTPAQVAAQKAAEETQVMASKAGIKTELTTPKGQAGTITVLPSEPTPQNFTGDGTAAKPLLVNGQPFTGERNGIKYENGRFVDATRADVIKADREAAAESAAKARAESNPLYNPLSRPQGGFANVAGTNYIVYYSWIGGREDGQWEAYRAEATPENMAKYGARVFAGATNASYADIQGVNTLQNQPTKTTDAQGRTAYAIDNNTFTLEGFVDTAYTPKKGSNIYQMINGTLYFSGVPYTGVQGDITYKDGKKFTGDEGTNRYQDGILVATKDANTNQWSATGAATQYGYTVNASGVVSKPDSVNLPFSGTTSSTNLPFTGSTSTTPSTTGTTTTTTTATPVYDINRQSAIKAVQDRFAKYGLSSLANKILELAQEGATEATITLQLQETPEYQQRFSANQERIKKGLTVLTPAEYLNLEDSYRQVLRAYGLKQFDNDAYVSQFISNDVSPAELSNRVVTAVQRVQNSDPQVANTLRDYYGIGTNDLVAYVLDPNNQLPKIERQVAAAEIGTAARLQGIEAGVGVAEQLAAQGITQAEARRGYSTIADILPTAEKLSQIYGGVEQTYQLAEAEQEVFNSLAEAQRRRQRLTGRETAQFSGASGMSRASLTQLQRGQF